MSGYPANDLHLWRSASAPLCGNLDQSACTARAPAGGGQDRVSAAAELETRGEAVTSRALAEAAHISLNIACAWLQQRHTDIYRSLHSCYPALQYSPYCTPDNMSTIPTAVAITGVFSDHPTGAPASELVPSALEPATSVLALTPKGVCPAASHQLLWRSQGRRLALPLVRHLEPAGAERLGPGPQRRTIMSQHHHRPPRMAPTTNRALRLSFASLAVCRARVQPACVFTRGRKLRLGTWWDTERSAAAHVAGCSVAPRALAGRTGSTLRLSQRGSRLVVKVSNGCDPTP